MQEYAAGSVTIDGRTVVILGDARADLARAVARAAEVAYGSDATITVEVDTTAADVIRLYAAANGSDFDRDLFELEEQLARRPRMVAPAMLTRRMRTRPRAPRSTPAVRRLSWLVEGRGR